MKIYHPYSGKEIKTEEELKQVNYLFLENGFKTKKEAEEFASKFPKYVKLYATTIDCSSECSGRDENEVHAVVLSISTQTKVTGEVNETGNKRMNAFIKGLKKMGFLEGGIKNEIRITNKQSEENTFNK